MTRILLGLLTLLFSLSGPAVEGNAVFWQSSLAAKSGVPRITEKGITRIEQQLGRHEFNALN